MYKGFFKRFLDFSLSLIALIVLFPLLIVLTIIGTIAMGGNPFFVQPRPGKKGKDGEEKIFNLVKFRTMDNRKDENGKLLADEIRLNSYGKFLRKTSLDELPELWNIVKGDLSIVGPRPLLVRYLPYYTEKERNRHNVRPGLTGLAQISGRNLLQWEDRFALDVEYVENLSFSLDIKIILSTIKKVFYQENIVVTGTSDSLEDFDVYRMKSN